MYVIILSYYYAKACLKKAGGPEEEEKLNECKSALKDEFAEANRKIIDV